MFVQCGAHAFPKKYTCMLLICSFYIGILFFKNTLRFTSKLYCTMMSYILYLKLWGHIDMSPTLPPEETQYGGLRRLG